MANDLQQNFTVALQELADCKLHPSSEADEAIWKAEEFLSLAFKVGTLNDLTAGIPPTHTWWPRKTWEPHQDQAPSQEPLNMLEKPSTSSKNNEKHEVYMDRMTLERKQMEFEREKVLERERRLSEEERRVQQEKALLEAKRRLLIEEKERHSVVSEHPEPRSYYRA
uniref:Uncharacterized protein n=1 Tax=Plectus sambesii TaxID=2011161 RepID=A0A914VR43_9BILA